MELTAKETEKIKMSGFNLGSIGRFTITALSILVPVIPNATPLNPKEFIAIANSHYPQGSPEGNFGDLSNEIVFQSIIKNGGQIVLQHDISESSVFKGPQEIAGIWDPNSGVMRIKIDSDYLFLVEALRHEAIHMAQSCSGYSLKSESRPIGLPITKEGMSKLAEYQESEPEYYYKDVEREAYSNENNSDQWVANLLDEYCGSKPWIPLFGKLRDLMTEFNLSLVK